MHSKRTNNRPILLCVAYLVVACSFVATGQSLSDRYANIGNVYVFHLPSSPFPHSLRNEGHSYGDDVYAAADHYQDSTVGVFVPSNFDDDKPFDLVVHIHGWWNNVDSVFAQFNLAEQLSASGRNAILVVPQGPKNAPDSFGGKLEETGAFRAFIDDVLQNLSERDIVDDSSSPGIILSGHSGAYRMIAFVLARGGLTDRIKEVYLFDALYAQLEKYGYWLDHYEGRLVSIYTDGGGTRGVTESFMEDLTAWGIPYGMAEENELRESDLTDNRVLFIHTDLEHNQVLSQRREFERFLRTGNGDRDTESH